MLVRNYPSLLSFSPLLGPEVSMDSYLEACSSETTSSSANLILALLLSDFLLFLEFRILHPPP